MSNDFHHLTDEELADFVAEVAQMRKEIDALKIKRDRVVDGMNELETLQADVIAGINTVKSHLRDAL
jgi:hypothetical protein